MDLEERNRLIKIGLIAFFIILFIFLVWKFVANIKTEYEEKNKVVLANIDNIDSYIVKEDITVDDETVSSNLVTTYSTFYTMQNAFSNYIEALIAGKYAETYNITTQDIKAKYDKATYTEKIKAFTEENFISLDSSNMYDVSDKLKYLYLIDDNTYVGEIENAYGNLVRIGIYVNTSEKTYKVFYVDM